MIAGYSYTTCNATNDSINPTYTYTDDIYVNSRCPCCGHSGDCSCRWISTSNEDYIEEEIVKEVKEKVIYGLAPLIQPRSGVFTKHFMCHRNGSTAKKIKLWSGLDS